MDPEATLVYAEELMNVRQYRECLEIVQDYKDWRVRGGWEPEDGDLRAKCIGGVCRLNGRILLYGGW